MPKMSLLGNLACTLTTITWHIQRCLGTGKRTASTAVILRDTNTESNGNINISSLASCISNSLFDGETICHLASAHIWIIEFYKYQVCNYGWPLHAKGKGGWCGFLQLLLCFSAGIKPFQWEDYWVKQEERLYFCQVGGSATTFEKGAGGFGWAVQLAAMAHTEGKNLHGLTVPKGVSFPK